LLWTVTFDELLVATKAFIVGNEAEKSEESVKPSELSYKGSSCA